MGARRPENIPVEIWRERAPTVWLMIAEGWTVRGRCQKCRGWRDMDLAHVGKRLGPQYSLWDRVPRCHQVGCWGAVLLEFKPPDVNNRWFSLCDAETVAAKQAQLDAAFKAHLASQPDPADPRNFGGG